MCECPIVISSDRFPCHANLVGMVKNYLVVNHSCEMTTCDIINAAYEHNAVYDTEENGKITEYFFVLFGEPMALPKGYTEEELRVLFHESNKAEVKEEFESNDNDNFFDDYELLKDGEMCPVCNNTGTAMVAGDAVPCELCLKSGRQY
ncbi:MAG: hypothetical protein PHZ07_01805 [Patescibacteria group bacterium]|nr:hypothetical protein [Patescibacteria group bacterium]MDD4304079.1 hypothetical protein [Patescibacteria group bacterium]MDD4694956.1 hypothetical protein [Patescibacteria group bacterium]